MSLREAMWQEVEAHEKARSDLAKERMEHAKTKAALFEVLSGHDGCGADGHFGLDGDPCCTQCVGWKRMRELTTPEERAKVEKAFRAKKLSGWQEQVEADEAERAGAVKLDFVNDIEKGIDIVERANRPAETDAPPRTEDFNCEGCGEAARLLHFGLAFCSEACRDEFVRAANQAVKRSQWDGAERGGAFTWIESREADLKRAQAACEGLK